MMHKLSPPRHQHVCALIVASVGQLLLNIEIIIVIIFSDDNHVMISIIVTIEIHDYRETSLEN